MKSLSEAFVFVTHIILFSSPVTHQWLSYSFELSSVQACEVHKSVQLWDTHMVSNQKDTQQYNQMRVYAWCKIIKALRSPRGTEWNNNTWLARMLPSVWNPNTPGGGPGLFLLLWLKTIQVRNLVRIPSGVWGTDRWVAVSPTPSTPPSLQPPPTPILFLWSLSGRTECSFTKTVDWEGGAVCSLFEELSQGMPSTCHPLFKHTDVGFLGINGGGTHAHTNAYTHTRTQQLSAGTGSKSLE